jgi:hypothetical protein
VLLLQQLGRLFGAGSENGGGGDPRFVGKLHERTGLVLRRFSVQLGVLRWKKKRNRVKM